MKNKPPERGLRLIGLTLILCLPPAFLDAADMPAGLLGVEPFAHTPPVYADRYVRDPVAGEPAPPMRLLLSRTRYWAEDGHLDAVVLLDAPGETPPGEIRVRVTGRDGRELSAFVVSPLPAARFVLYPAIPETLAAGGEGEISVAWADDTGIRAEETRSFRVEKAPEAPRTGRVNIRLPNESRVRARGVPATVGVPFPRGAFFGDPARLRLVDETGATQPLQARETARWSRFGSVKWVLCDFTVDLDGGPREFYLEYAPGGPTSERPAMVAAQSGAFPVVEAGRLRFEDGVWFDVAGDGNFVKVLDGPSLAGAFIEHEDGRRYLMPADGPCEIEESGPEKLVVRRAGWYREDGGDREFCRYLTRYVVHRDSPFLRVFHTWIFTGDGNHDRIRDMGWRFDLPAGAGYGGFLGSFDEEAPWLEGDYLLQHDYERFEIVAGDQVSDFPGGRAPGVAAVSVPGARIFFGARDFWQNYPSELEFHTGSLWFHNWPRHGKAAIHSFDPSTLEAAEFRRNVYQLRFAHEGETLDFRLPDAFAGDAVWNEATLNGREHQERHWDRGEPETANAQGIARTEEFWFYFAATGEDEGNLRRLLAAVNDHKLSAVADPAWVAASGAFYEIHHRDAENYPDDERIYELVALSPARWIERLGFYGMWVYGDIAAWSFNLDGRTADYYRAYRKRHQGWPYSWIPYARSGDPRFRKLAEAATRHDIDANNCHYSDDLVSRQVGSERYRRNGIWHRSLVPWAGDLGPQVRSYTCQCDFLWHAWYLTGDALARDQALAWGDETKSGGPILVPYRGSITLLGSYLHMYEATFDPWFLVAAHALAEGHLDAWRRLNWTGHFWRASDRDFLRFTGSDEYRAYYSDYIAGWADHRQEGNSWLKLGVQALESNAYAWHLSYDEYHLRRLSGILDNVNASVFFTAEPERPYNLGLHVFAGALFAGYYIQQFPLALGAFARAGRRPPGIYNSFTQRAAAWEPLENGRVLYRAPVIALRKEAAAPLFLNLGVPHFAGASDPRRYRLAAPGGETLLAGEMPGRSLEVVIPADAPGGVYRLYFETESTQPADRWPSMPGLELPVSPPGTPEVIELAPGEPMGNGIYDSQYWFRVPAGVAGFEIEFPRWTGYSALWDGDGRLVRHFGAETAEARKFLVEVPAELAGKLLRLTRPRLSTGFRMDPAVPPFYAVDADRWFDPRD